MFMKTASIISSIIAVIILLSIFIKVDTPPSKDTRVIIEHKYETYIAPPCFEQSDATNFLEESTMEHAEDIGYRMHDTCTEKALETEENAGIIHLFKQIGLLKKQQDEW